MKSLYALFRWLGIIVCTIVAQQAVAQPLIKGIIKDGHSGEPVPFASARWLLAGQGALADSSGTFYLSAPKVWDTLEVTSVGFEDFKIAMNGGAITVDTFPVFIKMVPGKFNVGVVVRGKGNRGLIFWKKIVANKHQHDRFRYDNFSYELYNKLELDLKNVDRDKMEKTKLFKDFDFILDYIDSAEGATFLPAYLTEAVSHYYYQKSPLKRREVFKGVKTLGVKNESISKFLGGMDQVVNIYNNYIPVFDKQFVSPISDNGDAYYNYKVADTQYVAGRRLIHFLFTPKRKGENTFEGDCWVHDSTYAIQKMNLRLGRDAGVNFVNQLSLVQEYALINDSTWFLSKDKFVVDLTPLGKANLSFIGRKTTTYRQVLVNDESIEKELAKNRKVEETVLPDSSIKQDEAYWSTARHEDLEGREQGIYQMIDTLMKSPYYQRYSDAVYFLTVGYKNIGNYEIGPWFNWISANSYEGLRLRFDLGTNTDFSKKVYLHGYLAYGFGDRDWKYKLDGTYLFRKSPRMHLHAAISRDIDFGQSYYDAISQDNIFALAIRKSGVPMKFLMVDEKKVELLHEWHNGFSARFTASNKAYEPLQNLPPAHLFTNGKGNIATSEIGVRLRYAFAEKFLESTFNRISLGSQYPIVDVRYVKGLSDVFKSGYDYHKLSASVSDYLKVAPFGTIYYNLFGGQTFGTLPYMLLDIAPGNEIYYYNPYAFNMMNRYEYLHDKYAGINVEHNFGSGLFRLLPLTRKLKFRQFWTAKALWGGLSAQNSALNMSGSYPFETLNGRTYLELGTGIDNIFRVLRVDFIWRALPESRGKLYNDRFGVFGSFRVSF
ncbi:MAG: DUF5686 family protein [Chitinophagaceae bacterium]